MTPSRNKYKMDRSKVTMTVRALKNLSKNKLVSDHNYLVTDYKSETINNVPGELKTIHPGRLKTRMKHIISFFEHTSLNTPVQNSGKEKLIKEFELKKNQILSHMNNIQAQLDKIIEFERMFRRQNQYYIKPKKIKTEKSEIFCITNAQSNHHESESLNDSKNEFPLLEHYYNHVLSNVTMNDIKVETFITP